MGFHGVQAEAATTGGVRYRTCVFAPNGATPPHEHDAPFFCVVLDGISEQRSGSEERTRARGQVFFYPAHERQSERFGDRGGTIFVVDDATMAIVGSLAHETTDVRWMPIARDYLHAHFAEKLSLARIAAAVGTHHATLSRGRRRHAETVSECGGNATAFVSRSQSGGAAAALQNVNRVKDAPRVAA